jgi:hypothetical protein
VGRLGLAPPERGSVDPHAMQGHCQFARHSDFGGLAAAALGHLQSPVLERREACHVREQDVRRLVQGRAHHLIANPADPTSDISPARLVPLRRQSKERSGVPGLLDAMGVIDRRLVGDRHDGTDTGCGHEPAAASK